VSDAPVTTADAAKAAGVTVRQLGHWAQCGYVRPEVVQGRVAGPGKAYRWSTAEVDLAEMLGVVSRQLGRPDLLGAVSTALREGTGFTLGDGDYEVVVTLRARAAQP
jgi:hypothetical protein